MEQKRFRVGLGITVVVAALAVASSATAVRIPEPPAGVQIVGSEAGSSQSERVRFRIVGTSAPPTPRPTVFNPRRNP